MKSKKIFNTLVYFFFGQHYFQFRLKIKKKLFIKNSNRIIYSPLTTR